MRARLAVALLGALTAVMAAPYALRGPNFILDDWFTLRNAMFDGAWAAGGHNQLLARPGAWVVYGLTFGLMGNHPLPIFVVQTIVTGATAVALFFVARRFVPAGVAFATGAAWIVAPTHTSLDNWASALNISLALVFVLLGIHALGRGEWNAQAAAWFALSALCYEATMPLAAAATLAVPFLAEHRRPAWRDAALPAAALALCAGWIVTHWHPDKHVGGWVDVSPVFASHFGWGIVMWRGVASVVLAAFCVAIALTLARLVLPSFRAATGAPERVVVAGLAIMAVGLVPFTRYLYAPIGAGDRVNVVSSLGGALVVVGLGWMATEASRYAAAALGVALACCAVATNVYRDDLYARAGDDVLRTMKALDRAIPHPDGPIALGPHPLVTDNIGGLLDPSNVDGALQVHRRREGLRGYVAQNRAEWLRAPARLRFDQRRP